VETAFRVLVVDDEPAIRLLCRINLELDGHRVSEAATLAEAEAALHGAQFDVVLVDVHLGGADGRDLVAHVRAVAPGTAIAFLTGSADRTSMENAGADAVIGKPFTIEELRETVERLGFARR